MASDDHAKKLYEQLNLSEIMTFEEFTDIYWESYDHCHGED